MSGHVRKNGREAAVIALASGETVAAAAAKAGVAERTLYRWRNEESFRREVAQARAEMFSRALGYMAEGAVSGALVLRQLCLKATSETVKLGAARALLELGNRLRESVELEARLAALEETLGTDGEKGR
jgi:transposase-like protein